jgi:hypothetical protein
MENGNLVINSTSTTTGLQEYSLRRGLQSTEDEVSYRHKSSIAERNAIKYQYEYYTDETPNDTIDFDEADDEGLYVGGNQNKVVSSGILTSTMQSDDTYANLGDAVVAGTLDSDYYDNLTLRTKATDTNWFIWAFQFQNPSTITCYLNSTYSTLTTSYDTYSYNIDHMCENSYGIGSDMWNGTVTYWNILFDETDGTVDNEDAFSIDYIYFYSTLEYNIIEFWEDTVNDRMGCSEDAEGWFTSAGGASVSYGSGYCTLTDPTGLSTNMQLTTGDDIVTSNYDTLNLTVRSSSDMSTFRFRIDVTIFTSSVPLTANEWKTISWDLTEIAEWTGTFSSGTNLAFVDPFDDSGSQTLDIDEMLLFNSNFGFNFTNVAYNFGLSTNTGTSLMVIQTYYYNASNFEWRIQLYDNNSNIVSYYNSSIQTWTDIYYRIEFSYNILESDFEVVIKYDNSSRIFKVDWTTEFTTNGTTQPALFNNEIPPDFYFNTSSVMGSSTKISIDFINAPFKIQEWRNILVPQWSNVTNNWQQYQVESNAQEEFTESTWRLTVPYLDTLSGKLFTQVLYDGAYWMGADEYSSFEFAIYSVDASDGSLSKRVQIKIYQDDTNLPKTRIVHPSGQFESDNLYGNVSVSFSVAISQDRTKLTTQTLIDLDTYDNTIDPIQAVQDVSISGESSEFVLEVNYNPFFVVDGTVLTAGITDFNYISKDLFGDIGNFFGGVVDGLTGAGGDLVNGILQGMADLLVAIFLPLILWIGGLINVSTQIIIAGLTTALNTSITALQAALLTSLATLSTVLSAAIAVLEPFLDGLEGLLQDVIDELVLIAAGIWTALEPVITNLLDIFLGLLLDVVNALMNIGESGWLIFWDGIFDIIDNTGGLKTSVAGFWPNVGTAVSDSISLLNVLASLSIFILIGLVFFIFSLPFLQSNGDVYRGTSGVFNNAFRGVKTPHVGIFGNQIALVIPLILIVYVALKLAIAAGTIPDIFGGLPI